MGLKLIKGGGSKPPDKKPSGIFRVIDGKNQRIMPYYQIVKEMGAAEAELAVIQQYFGKFKVARYDGQTKWVCPSCRQNDGTNLSVTALYPVTYNLDTDVNVIGEGRIDDNYAPKAQTWYCNNCHKKFPDLIMVEDDQKN